MTHSDELALIALSLDLELGVDLERRRSISQADRIVESYFTPAEQAQFAGLDEPARADAFLRGWTRKEAILKAKGVGLAGTGGGLRDDVRDRAAFRAVHAGLSPAPGSGLDPLGSCAERGLCCGPRRGGSPKAGCGSALRTEPVSDHSLRGLPGWS